MESRLGEHDLMVEVHRVREVQGDGRMNNLGILKNVHVRVQPDNQAGAAVRLRSGCRANSRFDFDICRQGFVTCLQIVLGRRRNDARRGCFALGRDVDKVGQCHNWPPNLCIRPDARNIRSQGVCHGIPFGYHIGMVVNTTRTIVRSRCYVKT